MSSYGQTYWRFEGTTKKLNDEEHEHTVTGQLVRTFGFLFIKFYYLTWIYRLRIYDQVQTSKEKSIKPNYFYEFVIKDNRNNFKKVSSV